MPVGVAHVEVVGSVLGLEEGQETTTEEGLSASRGAGVVCQAPAGGDVGQLDRGCPA